VVIPTRAIREANDGQRQAEKEERAEEEEREERR